MFDPDVIFEKYTEISNLRKEWKEGKIHGDKNEEQFHKFLFNTYHELFEPNSKLLKKFIFGELDDDPTELNRFLKMLSKLQDIKEGKITKEEQDKLIGQEYAKEFVDPIVNKLDGKI